MKNEIKKLHYPKKQLIGDNAVEKIITAFCFIDEFLKAAYEKTDKCARIKKIFIRIIYLDFNFLSYKYPIFITIYSIYKTQKGEITPINKRSLVNHF